MAVAYESEGEEAQLSEQLASELSILDDTLARLQNKLEEGEAGRKEDKLLLAELVGRVKKEQLAWVKETVAMDKLMAEAADLGTSQAELEAMRKKHDLVKRKVDLFTGLVKEREREIGVLQTQLEDVKQMGELKRMKEKAARSRSKQTVAAGSAVIGGEGVLDSRDQASFTWPAWDSDSGSSDARPPSPEEATAARLVQNLQAAKRISSQMRSSKVETPGLFIASGLLTFGKFSQMLWSAAKERIPKAVRVAVEVLSFSGTILGAASMASITHF